MELLREENASQSDNNTRLQTQVKELTSSLDSAQQSIHDAMVETRASTRLLTLEACKVPDLQKEVEELKKKLEDIEQDTARQHQDRQKNQVIEVGYYPRRAWAATGIVVYWFVCV